MSLFGAGVPLGSLAGAECGVGNAERRTTTLHSAGGMLRWQPLPVVTTARFVSGRFKLPPAIEDFRRASRVKD